MNFENSFSYPIEGPLEKYIKEVNKQNMIIRQTSPSDFAPHKAAIEAKWLEVRGTLANAATYTAKTAVIDGKTYVLPNDTTMAALFYQHLKANHPFVINWAGAGWPSFVLKNTITKVHYDTMENYLIGRAYNPADILDLINLNMIDLINIRLNVIKAGLI